MKHATYHGMKIDADQGVDIRAAAQGHRSDFRCCECGKPANVMRAGGKIPAHFEHQERNNYCSLVHQAR